jgi:peptide/nickel transport system substrate-binding protein
MGGATKSEEDAKLSPEMNRRDFLKATGAAGVAVGAGVALDAMGAGAAGASTLERAALPRVKRGGTLHFAIAGGAPGVDTPDPALGFDSFTIYTACFLFDTLVHADVNFNLTPQLATSWGPNAAATTWTFKIRSGVHFHNGKKLTSADVAYTFRRVLNPATQSTVLSSLSPFLTSAGISTPDASTVRFHLTQPNAFFDQILAQCQLGIIPAGTTNLKTSAVGTGAFKLKSWQSGASAVFVRNPDYWQSGKPYLDQVNMVSIPSDSTRLGALGHTQDFVDNITGSDILLLQSTPGVKQVYISAGGWEDLAAWGNQRPFNDPRVIRAMKLAENRKTQMELISPGAYQVTPDIPVPKADPFYPHGLEAFPYDPEQAKSLLKKAGFGHGLNLNLYAYQGDKLDNALAYKQTAKPAGININVIQWPHGTYWTRVYLKKPFMGDSWARQHVSVLLPSVFIAQPNEFHWNHRQFNQLVTGALRTANVTRQKTLIGDALKMLNDQLSGLIPGQVHQVYGARNNLEGVEAANSGQVYFTNAWFS